MELSQLREWLRAGEAPSRELRRSSSSWLGCLLHEWERLAEQDGVLYRCVEEPDTRILTQQLIVSSSYAQGLWVEYHRAAGHMSSDQL